LFKEDKKVAEKLHAIFASAVSMAKPGSGFTSQPFFTGGRVGETSESEQSAKDILGQLEKTQ